MAVVLALPSITLLAEKAFPVVDAAVGAVTDSVRNTANYIKPESIACPAKAPDGYHEQDYQKLLTFLEYADTEGTKNGEKVANNDYVGTYDPEDPETWDGVTWVDSDSGKRLESIEWQYLNLIGNLDLSGCTSLAGLYCSDNLIPELNISDSTSITALDCSNNQLAEIDLSNGAWLSWIYCDNNMLTKLDLSGCPDIFWVRCTNNPLTELDLSSNHYFGGIKISANGQGYIGIYQEMYSNTHHLWASELDGSTFDGWYSLGGEMLSNVVEFVIIDEFGNPIYEETDFVANFSGGETPTPSETPSETPSDTPSEAPSETPSETPSEIPSETPPIDNPDDPTPTPPVDNPDNPSVPTTGAMSIIGIGFATIASGAGMVIYKKKKGKSIMPLPFAP